MFHIEGYFNPHLSLGQNRLDAILTIHSDSAVAGNAVSSGGKTTGRKVIGFVLDVSGSMIGEKLAQAKQAARKGIDLLHQDMWFFIVTFSSSATVLVHACQATETNKAVAHYAIQQLEATGTTAMSSGLLLAMQQVQECDAAIASVYFQTDGDNNSEDNRRLPDVIERCKGVFQCDCRGIGTDWKPDELRHIAANLSGSADAITDPTGLEDDLRRFLSHSMSKGIAGAVLRLWSPKVVRIRTIRQMSPDIQNLLPLSVRVDEKTLDIPLGAWGTETRDYQLTFELPPGESDDEMLVCRAKLIFPGADEASIVSCDPIAVQWSENNALTARISKEVAHYTGQKELADSIQEGLEAKAQGDEDKATRLLGRAAQLAAQSGNEEVTRRLKKVVDLVDAGTGTVRLRKADKAAEMELELGGTRTVRRRAGTFPALQSS